MKDALKKLSLTAVLSLWGSLACADPALKIFVTLNPMGSFTAESNALRVGSYRSNGSVVEASQVVLPLNSLTSHVDLRDRHMKEKYFETQKYPEAVLLHATGSDGKFSGQLRIRNITKPIQGTYEMAGSEWRAHFKTRLSDFNIPKAKYMGVGVVDEVSVEVAVPRK